MPSRRRSNTRRKASVQSTVPQFPGQDLTVGSKDRDSIRAVQARLNQVGCGPIDENGLFNKQTKGAVLLFQARSVDGQGRSLKIDGIVGPLTWAALFGSNSLPDTVDVPLSPLLQTTLAVAASQIGVMEHPPGSNKGPEVDRYLEAVGLGPGHAWCAAFVYWVFEKAATTVNVPNPLIKTAGVLDHWNKAKREGITRLLPGDVQEDFSLIKPGLIFVMRLEGNDGHTGIVEGFRDDRLITIEGNTNISGGREGVGVFRRTSRKLSDINKGFISYDS